MAHCPCKPLNHLIQFESSVEPPRKSTEIAPKVSATDRMIGSSQSILDVAQHRIDPVKLRNFNTGWPTTGGNAVVRADRSNCTKAVQSVRDHFTVRRQVTSSPSADGLATEARDRGHAHTQWPDNESHRATATETTPLDTGHQYRTHSTIAVNSYLSGIGPCTCSYQNSQFISEL